MNYLDSVLELDEYYEDFLGLNEPSFDIEPDWWLELDLVAMAL